MTPQRQEWDDERIDEKFREIDARHRRTQRALRNRPTKRQVNERIAALTGSATRGQIIVAAIGAAALVLAAVITGLVDLHNSVPAPTK